MIFAVVFIKSALFLVHSVYYELYFGHFLPVKFEIHIYFEQRFIIAFS